MPTTYSVQAKFIAEQLPALIAMGQGTTIVATSRFLLKKGPVSTLIIKSSFDKILATALEAGFIRTGDAGDGEYYKDYGGFLFVRLLRRNASEKDKTPGERICGVELVRSFAYSESISKTQAFSIHLTSASFMIEGEDDIDGTLLAAVIRATPLSGLMAEYVLAEGEQQSKFDWAKTTFSL